MRTWRWATASAPSSMLCVLPSARSGRGHAAHRNRTGGRGVRIEPGALRQRFVRGEVPVMREHRHQLRDDGAFQTEMRVGIGVRAGQRGDEGGAHVHAAGEAHPPVHHQYLAVAAQVGVGHAQHAQRIGHEARHRHAAAPACARWAGANSASRWRRSARAPARRAVLRSAPAPSRGRWGRCRRYSSASPPRGWRHGSPAAWPGRLRRRRPAAGPRCPSSRKRLTWSPSTLSEANCGPEIGATSTGAVSTCAASSSMASSRCCDTRLADAVDAATT